MTKLHAEKVETGMIDDLILGIMSTLIHLYFPFNLSLPKYVMQASLKKDLIPPSTHPNFGVRIIGPAFGDQQHSRLTTLEFHRDLRIRANQIREFFLKKS